MFLDTATVDSHDRENTRACGGHSVRLIKKSKVVAKYDTRSSLSGGQIVCVTLNGLVRMQTTNNSQVFFDISLR